MAIRPILSTLARHRIAAGLIVVEVCLSFAFVCNALHMIAQRVEMLNSESGVDEGQLVNIDLRAIAPIQEADPLTAEDLRRLRALPGVQGVAVTNQIVYGDNSNNSGVTTQADNRGTRVAASSYSGDEHFIAVHGLRLIQGRNFQPAEVQKDSVVSRDPEAKVTALIINRALAEALYPGQSAVGKPIYVFGNNPSTIVGVVDKLPHPYPKSTDGRYAFIAPLLESFRGGTYVLRVDPARQQAVLKEATKIIREVDARRSVGSRPDGQRDAPALLRRGPCDDLAARRRVRGAARSDRLRHRRPWPASGSRSAPA